MLCFKTKGKGLYFRMKGQNFSLKCYLVFLCCSLVTIDSVLHWVGWGGTVVSLQRGMRPRLGPSVQHHVCTNRNTAHKGFTWIFLNPRASGALRTTQSCASCQRLRGRRAGTLGEEVVVRRGQQTLRWPLTRASSALLSGLMPGGCFELLYQPADGITFCFSPFANKAAENSCVTC